MKLIDEQLGGTTPLEVIFKFPEVEKKINKIQIDDEFDDWDNENEQDDEKYWFTKR